MKDLTIIVKTLDRYVCLKPFLKSVIKKYKDIPILIGDDSAVSCKKRVEKDFPNANITVYELPYDCGVSYGRNYLVNKVKTKYFCTCDDDFVFDKKTDLEAALIILKEKKLDIIGGYVRNYKIINSFKDNFIKIAQKILHYELPTNYLGTFNKKGDVLKIDYIIQDYPEYKESDLVVQFFIAKTESVKRSPWDNDLKMHEHTAFFYDAKLNGLKVAFSKQLSTRHCPIQSKRYKNFRKRDYMHVFMDKHGVSKMICTYDTKKDTITISPKLDNIFISVIVPLYNAENKAELLIRTLKEQTYKNFEAILVDNNSKDNTSKYIKDLIKDDKRFQLLFEKKQGPNHARYTGFKKAKGDYVYFADIDDFLDYDTLYQMVKKVTETKCDVVVGDYTEFTTDLSIIRHMNGAPNKDTNLKESNEFLFIKPALWNKLFKRELIKDNYFTYTSIGEDMVISLSTLAAAKDVRHLNFNVYNYILAEDGLSSLVKINHLLQMKDTADNLIKVFKENKKYETYKEEIDFIVITHILYRAFRGMLLKDKNERNKLRTSTVNYLDTIDVKDNKYYKKSKNYKFIRKVVYSKFWYNSFIMRFGAKLLFTNKFFNKILKKMDK